MSLSSDLISQFVKITNDTNKAKSETTTYGTISKQGDSTYVKLDGAETTTPVVTTVNVDDGDRVVVMIKNHTAYVTGNMSSPAARSGDIVDFSTEITELGIAIAKKVDTVVLDAERARIDYLVAEDVVVKNRLDASEAKIGILEADNVTIHDTLTANKASIESLEARTADIEVIRADVATIDSLIFGSASGNVIQTTFSNAVIAQLGDAQIKSAMIDSVSADKITAGDIITNNVRVKSEDGSLLISDETMQISDGTRVRVQIGKDASNDYSINIWDSSGNLMFSKGGITDSAIKDAIIRNDMVSDTANIAAHKLDIDSLFEEINDSTNTIKSTKVYLDDKKQTLDVAFKSLSSTVDSQGETITSQGTAISTIQGQISSKIWLQDINGATGDMSTQYSALSQDLESFKTTVGETYATKTALNDLEIGGRNLVTKTSNEWRELTVSAWSGQLWHTAGGINDYRHTYADYGVKVGDKLTFGVDISAVGKQCNIRVDYRAEDGTVKANGGNYIAPGENGRSTVTLEVLDGYVGFNVYIGSDGTVSENIVSKYKRLKIEKGDKATDWTPAPEDIDAEITDLDARILSAESSITQLSDSITANVTETTNLGTRMSTVEQTADSLSVELENLEIGGRNILLNSDFSDKTNTDFLVYNPSERMVTVTCNELAQTITSSLYLSNYGKSKIAGSLVTISAEYKITTELQYGSTNPYIGIELALLRDSTTGGSSQWMSWLGGTAIGTATTDGWVKCTKTIRPSDYGFTSYNLHLILRDFIGTVQFRNLKIEFGRKATDWTPAPEDVDSDILDASKTATNYLSFSSTGLVIGDMTASTLGKNILIDSDSVDIRSGTAVRASFGEDYLYLAKHSRNAKIDLCNGLATLYHQSKYSYDTLFVIDTPNATEIMGTYNPLYVTSTVTGKVAIQFSNVDGTLGSIGMVASGTGAYITRNVPSTAATYSVLDTGNFYNLMDSGWLTCAINTSGEFTIYDNGSNIKYRKIGKMVEVVGAVKPKTAIEAGTASYVFGTLPSGYRPSLAITERAQGSSGHSWLFSITTAGELRYSRYSNGSSCVELPAGAWLPFHTTFFTD